MLVEGIQEPPMLAEIFMLQLESAFRASEDAAHSKNFRFVPQGGRTDQGKSANARD
jgi:hypothetical protein